MSSQPPPFALQIELTEGCNLRCPFCGLNGIRGKRREWKFMSMTTAEHIVQSFKRARWNARIEFAMHGEPSLNPDMLEIIRMFRKRLPRRAHLMMTSNGFGFAKRPTETIDTALEYLNVLALEDYQGVNILPKILEAYSGVHEPLFYPQDRRGNPHRRRKPSEHELVVIAAIDLSSQGTHATLNNHAGCGAPKNARAMGKRCAKPFREMSVRWDGNVAVCCNDWRGEYKVGNVLESTLDELWQNPAMQAARRKLYHGLRDFGPCDGCDALSYRPGLLPDPLGKRPLPEPSEEDLRAISEALAGAPYTMPVLREWERKENAQRGAGHRGRRIAGQ